MMNCEYIRLFGSNKDNIFIAPVFLSQCQIIDMMIGLSMTLQKRSKFYEKSIKETKLGFVYLN